jgi:hypothetical protein
MRRTVPVLLVLGVLLLAPAASAQAFERRLKVMGDAPAVDPEGLEGGLLAPATGTARARFPFEVLVPPLSFCAGELRLEYDVVDAPPWAHPHPVLTSEARPFDPVLPAAAWHVNHGVYDDFAALVDVQVDAGAPGFVSFTVGVAARAIPDASILTCNLSPSDWVLSQVVLMTAYVPGIQADAPLEPRPGGLIPVRVRNEANAPTRVTFEWGGRDGTWVRDGFELLLESSAWGGQRIEQTARLYAHQAPADWDGRIRVTGSADINAPMVLPTHAVVLHLQDTAYAPAEDAWAGEDVPALPGLGWLAALGAWAAFARRRRP